MKCARSLRVLSGQMRSTLPALAVLAAAGRVLAAEDPPAAGALPAESFYVRTAHAARRTGPIEIDGKMSEPAWQAAPLEDNFTQVNPEEGKPASVHTAFRVLWDDEYLYFGAVCDDPEGATATLSRRDRFIEGDSVQFDLDTTFDRRTAYHFQVYAAGQQLDAIHFNDTDMTTDWDAAWDSAVAQTPNGWSVEMRIPLRVMRIPESAKIMGFNVYRILSRRKEEDQWRFRPQGRQGDISRLGLIDGIEGIRPVRELELRPYLGFKAVRNVPTYATPRSGRPERRRRVPDRLLASHRPGHADARRPRPRRRAEDRLPAAVRPRSRRRQDDGHGRIGQRRPAHRLRAARVRASAAAGDALRFFGHRLPSRAGRQHALDGGALHFGGAGANPARG